MADEEKEISIGDDDEKEKVTKEMVQSLLQVCTVEKVDRANYLFYTHAADEEGNLKEAVVANLLPSVGAIKYLRNFEEGDWVLCIFPQGGIPIALGAKINVGDDVIKGLAVGTFFNLFKPAPEKACGEDHEIRFGESKITIKPEGELFVKCAEDVAIEGKEIFLN